MTTLATVLNSTAILLGGGVLCFSAVIALGMSGDDCGPNDRRLLCTGIPQVVGVAMVAVTYLGAFGTALAPLFVDGGPGSGTPWVVLVAGLVASVVLPVAFGHLPRPGWRPDGS